VAQGVPAALADKVVPVEMADQGAQAVLEVQAALADKVVPVEMADQAVQAALAEKVVPADEAGQAVSEDQVALEARAVLLAPAPAPAPVPQVLMDLGLLAVLAALAAPVDKEAKADLPALPHLVLLPPSMPLKQAVLPPLLACPLSLGQ
jgi:hypothetical protein